MGRAQTVTFNEHIAPIVYANCTKCHRPGQVAPFSLLTYDDVRAHARTITTVTQSRYMPPWKPEPGWAAYRDERRLTPGQISLIQQWVDGRYAAGRCVQSAARAPVLRYLATRHARPDSGNARRLFRAGRRPRHLPQLRHPHQPHLGQMGPRHRAQTLRAQRGASFAVLLRYHRRRAQSRTAKDGQPGFPGFGSIFTVGDPLGALNGGLGGWVPGTTPAFLPQGVAMPLPKGSDFLMQTHFHPNGAPQSEKTVIGLYFGPKPARLMTQLQVPAFFGVRANIDIPAGETDYKVRGSFTLPADVDAVGVAAHAHYLAKEAKLTATLPNGEVRILLWIRQWEFNWQDQYHVPGSDAAAQGHAARWRIDLRQLRPAISAIPTPRRRRCDGAKTPPTKWAA